MTFKHQLRQGHKTPAAQTKGDCRSDENAIIQAPSMCSTRMVVGQVSCLTEKTALLPSSAARSQPFCCSALAASSQSAAATATCPQERATSKQRGKQSNNLSATEINKRSLSDGRPHMKSRTGNIRRHAHHAHPDRLVSNWSRLRLAILAFSFKLSALRISPSPLELMQKGIENIWKGRVIPRVHAEHDKHSWAVECMNIKDVQAIPFPPILTTKGRLTNRSFCVD